MLQQALEKVLRVTKQEWNLVPPVVKFKKTLCI